MIDGLRANFNAENGAAEKLVAVLKELKTMVTISDSFISTSHAYLSVSHEVMQKLIKAGIFETQNSDGNRGGK